MSENEIPTLLNGKAPEKINKPKTRSVEDENKRLKDEIKKLKATSAVLFGTAKERLDTRLERILTVSGFKRDILGWVAKPFRDSDFDVSFSRVELPGIVNRFHFYKRSAEYDIDLDDIMYVAQYSSVVDLQNELADIRLLLAACSKKDIPCKFVIATNEDLTDLRSLVLRHFKEIRTALPLKSRKSYSLELWDQIELLKLEYDLKIKVAPKSARKRKPAK